MSEEMKGAIQYHSIMSEFRDNWIRREHQSQT